MPLRHDISKVLVIGAGPIVIGQACEFDYSGTQACKALREEGIDVVLVNSNPATIMTDPAFAFRTYIEPITVDSLTAIIRRERPDALLPTMGGQTALNLAVALDEAGVLRRFDVELLGASAEVIRRAEDRGRFRKAMASIGLAVPKSGEAHSVDEVLAVARDIGSYPIIVRAGFTLGGAGGGIAYDEAQLLAIASNGLALSPANEVLVEESVLGWKEFEMEVMRDGAGNACIVCSIENLDPMGVHTGDSITVAPAMTLSDPELQRLRDASLAVMDAVGVETGGANVQFAVNPRNGAMVVIEMNPRVSRSSALASKATGFPIAKIAAKVAVGLTLPEIANDITRATPACFEPALDYVVCKIPRWDLSKFHGVNHELGSSMKSVGEVMAIGHTFEEAIQKGLRMIGQGMHGFVDNKAGHVTDIPDALSHATDTRIFVLSKALQMDYTIEQLHELTQIDRWFLQKLRHIVVLNSQLQEFRQLADMVTFMEPLELLEYLEAPEFVALLRDAKVYGFSDFQIARALGLGDHMTMEEAALLVRGWRKELGVVPTVNQIDTLAAEYPAQTNYLYLTYR